MAQKTGLQLFVSRLSSYTTNHEFKRLFSPFGVVTEARLVVEPKTHRPKGFGFVTFESEADADKALKAMNGRVFSYFFLCFFLYVFLMATKLCCRTFSLFLVYVNSVILHRFLAQTL
ncbi:hypothetical protein SADUNF_Sadunf16G0128400 [Salix dunnii]|uniref:RRM domain-containing protein n=1 Tax=Salix dunnii TaxID=1413687 RepID=A0A835JAU5_9ROSI|nr:hypothetical protein SADUNF_Sadunf16G0128400 [Salix dunnii]